MSAMIPAHTKLQQAPPLARLWLSSLLLLGVLSMHGAIVSDEGGLVDHHGAISAVQSSAAAIAVAGDFVTNGVDVPDLVPLQDGEPGLSMSDCGGIVLLCLVMIVGTSAYVLLRGRAAHRVTWHLAPTAAMTLGGTCPPFEVMNPRERSSVLRR